MKRASLAAESRDFAEGKDGFERTLIRPLTSESDACAGHRAKSGSPIASQNLPLTFFLPNLEAIPMQFLRLIQDDFITLVCVAARFVH